MFGIKAGQITITRDVNFDEATFGFSMEKSNEIIEDAIMDLDLLEITKVKCVKSTTSRPASAKFARTTM